MLVGCNGGPVGQRGRVEELVRGDFYRTTEMERPRYEHVAVPLDDGTVLVAGGSDERLFTTIDLCEIFDQKLVVEPEPPSKSGGWIHTDFEGEDLRLQDGGRVFHTGTRVNEGDVMVLGGAMDAIMGEVLEHGELFDRSTRKFATMGSVMLEPRFHHTAVAVNEGEVLIFGGQIHVNVTVVDPNYPPSDPRFIREINTFPSTRTIEKFDSSLDSEDGLGNFAFITNDDGLQAVLSGNQGRSIHGTARIAGLDSASGNLGDVFVQAGGIQTLSPVFAPQSKLRRLGQGEATLLNTLDIYDGFTRTAFLAPGVSLNMARAHAVMADTVGWRSDLTFDNIRGLSNVFIVSSGSTDTLPTCGVWESEVFAATFSGFGPGAGVSLVRAEPLDGDPIEVIIEGVLGSLANDPLIAFVYDWTNPAIADFLPNPLLDYTAALDAIENEVMLLIPHEFFLASKMGKYFSIEAYYNPEINIVCPINRIHTQFVRVLRQSFTPAGSQIIGTLFCAGGGYLVGPPLIPGQFQLYDGIPTASAEFFDPNYNLVNAFFATQHEPYDLFTVRTYWSVKVSVPLPEPGNEGKHPHPTGVEGSWVICDGFVPGNGFEGFEWLPPYTSNPDDYRIRFMEKGRGWHTSCLVPGADGRYNTIDDRVLLVGGGDDVLAWGGQPVVPSAIIYVPPSPR